MKKEQNNKNRKTRSGFAQEAYWDYVGSEAKQHVGNNPQLKGTIHEIAYRARLNLSPENLTKGKVSRLSKSPTAKSADIVTLKEGKITERIQLKDVTDKAGINNLNKKVLSNKYRNSKLVGTE